MPPENKSSLWWLATASKGDNDPNEALANWVTRVATSRETDQIQKRWRSTIFYRHQTGRPNSAQFAYSMARRPSNQQQWYSQFEFTPATFNTIATNTDVYINRLFKTHSFLEVSADRGDFEMYQTGLGLEQWIDGAFDDTGFWAQWGKLGWDACTYGTAFFKFGENDMGEMAVTRPHPDEMLFANPDDESMDEVIQRVWGKRDEMLDRYGDTPARRRAIEHATSFPGFYIGTGLDCSNVIPVLESWKCPYGPKKNRKKGRHSLVIGNVTLLDEEYDEASIPFEAYQFHELDGVFGQGLAEILLTLDDEFNTELSYIVENLHRCGFPKWLVEENSGVNPDSLGDISAAIVNYLGTKPEMIAPPPNTPQMFENLDRVLNMIMKRSHLSEAAVQSTTPAGLKSGTALERWQAIEDANFGEMAERLEAFLVRCGYQMIRLGKRLKPSVTLAGSNRQVIDWVDLKIKKGKPKFLKSFPMSRLSQIPAGRAQELEDMLRRGTISKTQYTRALQVNDVNGLLDQVNAPIDNASRQLDRIVKTGDYEPPAPFLLLPEAKTTVENRYLIEDDRGTPKDRLDLLLQWRAAIIEMIEEQRTPEAPNTPTPPGFSPQAEGEVPVANAQPLENPLNAIT